MSKVLVKFLRHRGTFVSLLYSFVVGSFSFVDQLIGLIGMILSEFDRTKSSAHESELTVTVAALDGRWNLV